MLKILTDKENIFKKRIEFLNLLSTYFKGVDKIKVITSDEYHFIEFYYLNSLFQFYYLETGNYNGVLYNKFNLVILETKFNPIKNRLDKVQEIQVLCINHYDMPDGKFYCELNEIGGESIHSIDSVFHFIDRYKLKNY